MEKKWGKYMLRFVISDYDDTLYIDEGTIRGNIERIKAFQTKGNLFAIATSRSFSSINEEIKKYNLPYDYLLTNMGAGIFDVNNNILYENYMNNKERQKIEEILKNYSSLEITRFGIIEEQPKGSEKIVGYKIKGNIADLKTLEEILKNNLNEVEIKLKKAENKMFLNDKNNAKEKGINELIQIQPELKRFEIVTVGDDDVDFGMLKKYDGYRMIKSSELLMKNITKIISSVGELMS